MRKIGHDLDSLELGEKANGVMAGYEYLLTNTSGFYLSETAVYQAVLDNLAMFGGLENKANLKAVSLSWHCSPPYMGGAYIGTGLGGRTATTIHSGAYAMPVETRQIYVPLDVGWRSRGAFYLGVDVQLAAIPCHSDSFCLPYSRFFYWYSTD